MKSSSDPVRIDKVKINPNHSKGLQSEVVRSRGKNARRKQLCLALLLAVQVSVSAAEAIKPTGESMVRPRVGIDTSFGDRFHEALEAMGHDRYQEAIAKANAALAMKPDAKNAALLFTCRGLAYYGLRAYDRAIADFSEAIRRDPQVPTARANRGLLLAYQGHYEKAISDLTQAGPETSSRMSLHASLADAYFQTGRRDKARAEYARVTQLPVKDKSEYAMRAKAYVAVGQYKAAALDFAAATKREPSDSYVLNAAAWFAATCLDSAFRDGRSAVRDATRACEGTHWKDAGYIDTLAAAYAETGDFAHAIQYARQAIAMGGGSARERNEIEQHLRLFEKGQPVQNGGKLL
jgi:tetratricopeptide (TPR) repeat protein